NASDLRRWPALGLAAGVSTALLTTLAGLRFYTPARLAAEVAGASTSQDPARVLTGGTAAQSAMDSLGVVGAIADPLFRTYLVPFEITSVLLLTAAVGAVVIAKRRI
ncbi:MAG: NADH-quinone oxidoreductase subunit J, partial [Gemmatimonadota bacterium]